MKRYAISDIHGCRKTFLHLLQTIGLNKEDELFLLGDYIDRGPDSKGVIDDILELQESGFNVHCLMGNHESMLLDLLFPNEGHQLGIAWASNGGMQTLESFKVVSAFDIPAKYIQFFKNLEYYFEVDEYILVHGGLKFFPETNPLELRQEMLWARNWYDEINYDWLGERIVVHGHTPQPKIVIETSSRLMHRNGYIDIDAGCCFKNRSVYGYLCCLNLTDREMTFVKNVD